MLQLQSNTFQLFRHISHNSFYQGGEIPQLTVGLGMFRKSINSNPASLSPPPPHLPDVIFKLGLHNLVSGHGLKTHETVILQKLVLISLGSTWEFHDGRKAGNK